MTFSEAVTWSHSKEWANAMDEEMQSDGWIVPLLWGGSESVVCAQYILFRCEIWSGLRPFLQTFVKPETTSAAAAFYRH